MIYLFESKLPETKSVHFALRYVYGIGTGKSVFICKKLGFTSNFKIKNLSESQVNRIVKLVELLDLSVANDLRRLNLLASQKLVSIKSYRGLRRRKGLPVRGQRTHTNAKTAKRVR